MCLLTKKKKVALTAKPGFLQVRGREMEPGHERMDYGQDEGQVQDQVQGSGSRIKDQGLQKGRKTERSSDIGKMLQRQVHHGKGKQTRCNAMGAEKRKKTDRRSKTTIVVKASLVTTNFSCRCENLYLDFNPHLLG